MDEPLKSDIVNKPAEDSVNLVARDGVSNEWDKIAGESASKELFQAAAPYDASPVSASLTLDHGDMPIEIPLESFALFAVRSSVARTALVDGLTVFLFSCSFCLPPIGTVGMMFALPALRIKLLQERATYSYEVATNVVTTEVSATHARIDSALRLIIGIILWLFALFVCFAVFRGRHNAPGAVVGLLFSVGFLGLRSFQYFNPVGYMRWLLSLNRRKNPDAPVLKGEIH